MRAPSEQWVARMHTSLRFGGTFTRKTLDTRPAYFDYCSHVHHATRLHQLVCTANELQPVDLVELTGHLAAEKPA